MSVTTLNTTIKHDLRELELTLENKIKDVELKIEQSKVELVRWVIGSGLLQALFCGLAYEKSSGATSKLQQEQA